jgi:predicted Fe-Mo cluster-binding NifX family protein
VVKIAATAMGTTLDSVFDPKFGRCRHVLVIDTDDMRVECVDNPHRASSGGAGSRFAQLMLDRRVGTVLTGEVGPNARQALDAAGITVVTGCAGSIADAVAGLATGRPGRSD